ncbi:MAG: restriction endonuclease subunit S [Flavobacteriales bacterium]|nr:restriction endonuclease subunit S [Flavobacteriales bacterium]
MSEWKEVELGEVCDLLDCLHKTPKYSEEGYPMVRVTDVKNGYLDTSECLLVNEEVFTAFSKGYEPKVGDIVFTRVGSFGLSAIVKQEEEFCIGQNTTLLIPKTIDPFFIFYYLIGQDARFQIEGLAGGSTQPTISMASIRKIVIPFPPPEEQKAIAEVLSSLDDKIDLLHRQNQTLEQMAETLFRQWFVEEADDDWEFTSLENFVTCFNGVSYKSADLNPSDTAMITLKSFARDGGFRLDGFKEYTGKYKEQHIVNEGELVVAHTDITQDAALIGNPIMVIGRREYKKLLISMDLVKVVSNYDWLSNEFLYYQMKSRDFKQHCLGYSNGSTVLHLSKEAVPSYEFFLPPKELIADFTNQVKPLIEKSNKNIKHIRNLEEIRDTILPKLMAGEVRILNKIEQ